MMLKRIISAVSISLIILLGSCSLPDGGPVSEQSASGPVSRAVTTTNSPAYDGEIYVTYPRGPGMTYVEIRVGNYTATASGLSPADLASSLASAFNSSLSPVTAKLLTSTGPVQLKLKTICAVPISVYHFSGAIPVYLSTDTLVNNPKASLFPKYVVLAVIYAPPGPKSNVNYGESTKLGTSSTVENLFSNSLSITSGIETLGVKMSMSANWTSVRDTTRTLAIENTTSMNKQFAGPVNALDGIDHDADSILLWINPQVNFRATSASTVRWDYAYDKRDPANSMHVYEITVADLKTWIANGLPANMAAVLDRTWAGPGQGLTTQDLKTILAQDPFQAGFADSDVIEFNPARFVLQSAAGTFTYKSPQPGNNPSTYTFTNLSQTSRSSNVAFSNSFSVGISVSVEKDFIGVAGLSFGVSDTMTWMNKSSDMSSCTDGTSASVTFTGPSAPLAPTDPVYTGPTQVQIYLDTLYNSYVFAYVPPSDLRANLVAYYPFAGNTNDKSGHNLNGINHGATPATDRKGISNGAYHFNGSSTISIPTSSYLNNMSGFTLCAWVSSDLASQSGVILSKVSPNRDFVLDLTPDGAGSANVNAHFAHGATYYHIFTAQPKVPANTWTFLAAVWTGTTWQMYINGVLSNEVSTNGKSPLWTGTDIEIGALLSGGSCGFTGSIDDVRIFNKALNAGEINWLMWQ